MATVLHPSAAFSDAFGRLFTWPGRSRATRAMVMPAAGDIRRLQKGAIFMVSRPMHLAIDCLRGSVWITHDGDPKDIILEVGQSHRPDRDAPMLIQALEIVDIRVAVSNLSHRSGVAQ